MLEQEAKIKTISLKYYNSHGFSMPWNEMVQTEIGRGNYTKREFNNWAKKYNIKPNDNVIWVTANKNIAVSYTAPSSDYEKILSMSDSQLDKYIISEGIELNEYTQKDGNLINESDDGDEGYILLLSEKYEKGGYTEKAKGPLEKELDNKLATLKTKDEQLRKQYFNLKLDLGKKAVKVSQVNLFGTQKVGKLFDDTVSLTEAENVARKLLKEADTEIVKNRAEINRLEKSRDEIIKADSNQISMFAKGGKTEAINKKGDCYEVTGNVAMSNSKTIGTHYFKGTPYIVHAEVTGQGAIKDIRYGHAWIEDDINVYEYSNGNEITIPIELYYKWGKVNRSPNKYYKYTFNDAINKMLDTQHYGPWDLKTESGL